MELVYVYIDNFKNLKEKEINLSPLVKFTYNREKKTLSFEKRSDQPKNFFSENIVNITGLIGGNGSGKTSILEFILRQNLYLEFYGYIFIYYERESKRYNCFHTNLVSNKLEGVEFEIVTRTGSNPKHSSNNPNQILVYFSNFFHGINIINQRQIESDLDVIDISSDAVLGHSLSSNKGRFGYYIEEISIFMHFFSNHNKFLSKINFPAPQYIKVNINKSIFDIDVLGKRSLTDRKVSAYSNSELFVYKLIEELKVNPGFKLAFLIGLLISLDYDRKNQSNVPDIVSISEMSNIELSSFILELTENNFGDLKETKELLLKLDELEKQFSFKFDNSVFKIEDFIVTFQSLSKYRFGQYYPFELTWSAEDKGEPIKFSGGENTMISLFSRIYQCNLQNTDKTILILLDEPDISLHPNYQKKFLSYFISFLEEVYPDRKNQFQIIITSHSPFIASDLPKDNVQYLDEDVENKQETFAANIHDLLANSYYMKDGFVGAFAKEQINKIISQLESNEDLEEEKAAIEYVISRIGEPLVKKHLQSMFDAKFNTSYDERIDNLRKEIERIEEERRQAESKENENRTEDEGD